MFATPWSRVRLPGPACNSSKVASSGLFLIWLIFRKESGGYDFHSTASLFHPHWNRLSSGMIQLVNLGSGIKAQASSQIQGNPQTQHASPNCSPCYYFYGSNLSWMSTATSDWFQKYGNWCGVANVRAIQRYD